MTWSWPLAMLGMLLGSGCGDAFVAGDYRGEPALVVKSSVSSMSRTVLPNETVSVNLLWLKSAQPLAPAGGLLTTGNEALHEVAQVAAAGFPSRLDFLLHDRTPAPVPPPCPAALAARLDAEAPAFRLAFDENDEVPPPAVWPLERELAFVSLVSGPLVQAPLAQLATRWAELPVVAASVPLPTDEASLQSLASCARTPSALRRLHWLSRTPWPACFDVATLLLRGEAQPNDLLSRFGFPTNLLASSDRFVVLSGHEAFAASGFGPAACSAGILNPERLDGRRHHLARVVCAPDDSAVLGFELVDEATTAVTFSVRYGRLDWNNLCKGSSLYDVSWPRVPEETLVVPRTGLTLQQAFVQARRTVHRLSPGARLVRAQVFGLGPDGFVDGDPLLRPDHGFSFFFVDFGNGRRLTVHGKAEAFLYDSAYIVNEGIPWLSADVRLPEPLDEDLFVTLDLASFGQNMAGTGCPWTRQAYDALVIRAYEGSALFVNAFKGTELGTTSELQLIYGRPKDLAPLQDMPAPESADGPPDFLLVANKGCTPASPSPE
ncbi:MAG: hypothetical protein KA712_17255 [Myxococcales bacterium]|nr:hypothetical protein [Myxococcales bacterium]